eukprot:COSAG01_NODE_58354_length_306_cov_1.449275_1_plen_21_part_01
MSGGGWVRPSPSAPTSPPCTP